MRRGSHTSNNHVSRITPHRFHQNESPSLRRNIACLVPPAVRYSLIALILILLTSLLPAVSLAQGPDSLPASAPAAAPDLTNNISLNLLGRYAGIGAEIAAYDPATKRLYVTGPQLQIVDISNPVSSDAGQHRRHRRDQRGRQERHHRCRRAGESRPGSRSGGFPHARRRDLKTVTVGALPDMLTFTSRWHESAGGE